MAVVRPAGGFLNGAPHNEIPLMIVVVGLGDDEPGIKSARITAAEGQVRQTRVLDRARVMFHYRPRRGGSSEIFDVALTLDNGNTIAEAFTLRVPASAVPALGVRVEPELVAVGTAAAPSVTADSMDSNVEQLQLFSTARELDVVDGGGPGTILQGDLTLPALPTDAPSYVQVVGVATTANDFRVESTGIRVRANIRLSVEIPPRSTLVVDGAAGRIEPVPAADGGRTVMENVPVVYGQRLRAFSVRGRRRKALSVVIPTGFAAPLVVPLPDQTMADGGTGATLAVVIPPSPLGGQPFWPDIRVEGARLVDVQKRGSRTKVLVLERPKAPRTVRVLLDDEEAAAIEFTAGRAQFLRLRPSAADGNERAALLLTVTDATGAPTDNPVPNIRAARPHDVQLDVQRRGPGEYRITLPPGTPGGPGDSVEVVADVPPAPTLLGDRLELVQASSEVKLLGPAPALAAAPAPPPARAATAVPTQGSSSGWRFGLSAAALAGATTASDPSFGAGLMAETRFPFWAGRLGLRLGFEFVRISGDGAVPFGDGQQFDATTVVAGLRIPLELGFSLIQTDVFELILRAGGAVRVEEAAIEVGGDSAGGQQQTSVAGRAGLHGAVGVGTGDLTLGFSAVGLGASLDSSPSDSPQLTGDLIGFRGELGYRFWF